MIQTPHRLLVSTSPSNHIRLSCILDRSLSTQIEQVTSGIGLFYSTLSKDGRSRQDQHFVVDRSLICLHIPGPATEPL